jgi:hypothetical protein
LLRIVKIGAPNRADFIENCRLHDGKNRRRTHPEPPIYTKPLKASSCAHRVYGGDYSVYKVMREERGKLHLSSIFNFAPIF